MEPEVAAGLKVDTHMPSVCSLSEFLFGGLTDVRCAGMPPSPLSRAEPKGLGQRRVQSRGLMVSGRPETSLRNLKWPLA
jgi:hypothetical protein